MKRESQHKEALRRLDGMNGHIHSLIFYDTQCNFEYQPEMLRKLAQLGLTYTVSCDQAPEAFGRDSLGRKRLE